MHENEKNMCKRSNHPEISESKSSRLEHRICYFRIPASKVIMDSCFISSRGTDLFARTVLDYTECVESQGHTRCGPFLCTTLGEFFFKDSKQNVRRFKPTQKVTEKRHDGVPDKIGHLLQTVSISQLISIVLVPSIMGISTKDLEILYVHFDTDLIIKTMGTKAKRQQIYYVCLERSAERFFAQVGLAFLSLQTVEADTKLMKLHFLCEEKLRQLKRNYSLMCTLQQSAKLLRNSYSKSGYLNVKRFSNNEGQHFCCQTEKDGNRKCKTDSQKPEADEYEIQCASPLQRVGQQPDKKKEKMNERICAQHDSSEKSKKSHSFGIFDEKQMEQFAQLPRQSGSSVHNKAAVKNDQDFIPSEQEQSSIVHLDLHLTKSQRLPERQYGHHIDTNADRRDWLRACGIKTPVQWLLRQTRQDVPPSPPRQTQSMPPHRRHQSEANLRSMMKRRNFRVASLVHLLPKGKVKDMADAGLYLDEQAGLFCCPDCSLQVRQSQWPWEQRPEDVHRRRSPDCPAVNPAARAGRASSVTQRSTDRGRVLSVGAGEQRHLSSLDENKEKGECSGAANSMRDGEDETADVASEREREGQAYTTSVKDKIKGQMHEAHEKAESLFTASVEDGELENDPVYIPKIQDVSHVIPSNNDLQADCGVESSTPSYPSTGHDSSSS